MAFHYLEQLDVLFMAVDVTTDVILLALRDKRVKHIRTLYRGRKIFTCLYIYKIETA